jgi:hypothetical protein
LLIFIPLLTGFAVQSPLLDAGGALNWVIWNGVSCGNEPCHVPPMLFVIYVVRAAFALLAARSRTNFRRF